MSIWTLVKILVGLVVIGLMILSGMLAWHVLVEPQGGIFEKLVPNTRRIVGSPPEEKTAALPKEENIPKVDPGVAVYEKARELLALGQADEARAKLVHIITSFPTSTTAPVARGILTTMNLDEVLSSSHMEGKQRVVVKRGDSFLAIAGRNQTTMDMIEHLNAMEEMKPLHLGEELLVMPLNYRVVLEPKKKNVSLWAGENFVAEWPAREMHAIAATKKPVKISAKPVVAKDGKALAPQSAGYRGGDKSIQIAGAGLWLRPWDGVGEKPSGGVLLDPADLEDLFLLTRVGNDVEVK